MCETMTSLMILFGGGLFVLSFAVKESVFSWAFCWFPLVSGPSLGGGGFIIVPTLGFLLGVGFYFMPSESVLVVIGLCASVAPEKF